MKKIFGGIFAAWAILIFALDLLLFTPIFAILLYGFKDPKRAFLAYPFYTAWMKVFLPLVGIRVEKKGREKFIKGETYIVTVNHNSYIDPPVCSPYIPVPTKAIAKSEMGKIPIFGIIYRLGGILVNRKDPDSKQKSYLAMKKTIEQKISMCVYPEGTRNKTEEPLIPFYDGAFRLAVETQTKIIPAILLGTRKVLPRDGGFYFWPSKIGFHFLDAIEPGNDVQFLKQKVFDVMANYYTLNRKNFD